MSYAGNGDSLGYQQLAVDTATGVTIPANKTPYLWLFTPEVQACRWRDDGVNPTATVGNLLSVGSILRYDMNNINQLKFISVTAGSLVNCNAYGKNP